MSIFQKIRQIIQSLSKATQQSLNYIGAAVMRVFSITDDQYPLTGVQPFEGEITRNKKQKAHQSH